MKYFKRHFYLLIVFLVIAIAILLFDKQQFLQDSANGTVTPAQNMGTKRSAHTATRLTNGNILICGGILKAEGVEINNASAELFVNTSEKFIPTGNMHFNRAGHTATLLQDGNVLITGGFDSNGFLASAEIYHTRTGRFELLKSLMSAKRAAHTATLLPNGKILIVGGVNGSAASNKTIDLYDPQEKTFQSNLQLNFPRTGHTATRLADGRVLIVGGSRKWRTSVMNSCEIYDPVANSIRITNSLKIPRNKHVAVLLKNGRVLIAGGSKIADEIGGRYSTAELFDPLTNTFRMIESKMIKARFKISNAADVLENGDVVIAGDGKYVEVFNTGNENFSTAQGTLKKAWMYPTVTILSGDRILITGGYDQRMATTDGAWIYKREESTILAIKNH